MNFPKRKLVGIGGVLMAFAVPIQAQQEPAVSERDYLGDVPIVLSVSRLPQRLDETPGAVTIIDRQMIRMSGARDVAELLRLVPGFRVSDSFESNSPQGSYHTYLSDYSNRMQVMVDGRSVYSVYMQGGTGPGLQAVALEDIERIEVYRGSNSASYGARAFLGTINIVTRDPVDTLGIHAQVAAGTNGIRDGLARLGWGSDQARFRLSVDGRGDDNLQGTSGPIRVQRINFRADLRASARDVVEVRTGQSVIDAGVGFVAEAGNAVRTRQIDTSFLQMDWRRSLGVDQDLALQASHTEEIMRDQFVYAPVPAISIDTGGRASNDSLTVQHIVRLGKPLRLVWGGELRRETIASRRLYDTGDTFVSDFSRLFANAEWRLQQALLLNAGAMFERSSIAGEHLSPRLMLNWRMAEGHTVRLGMTQAMRPPSNYEKYANVRFYLNGLLAESTDVARGNVIAEKVQTREIGYLAELPGRGVNLDVRAFEENVTGLIKRIDYALPGSGLDNIAHDFVNDQDFRIHGFEYQLKWRPWGGGLVIYSHSMVDSDQTVTGSYAVPSAYATSSLMLMQELPAGYQASLVYFEADPTQFPGANQPAPAFSRTDVRLARSLRMGGRRAELSLTVQNLGAAYQDFRPDLRYSQRAYLMLRMEN